MDKPTIKEQLQKYGKLTKELKQLEERIQTLRSSMYSLKSPTFDDVPCGGGNSDKIGNVVCLMESLEEKYLSLVEQIVECQNGIIVLALQLKADERLLIIYRYIDNLKWSDISILLGHDSERKTHRLHNYILVKLGQLEL